jgi:hypothetical protein
MDDSAIRKLTRSLLGGAVAVMLVAGSIGHALAQDDDDDDELPDVKFFRSILTGLGLKKDGTASGIDYHERSPLVVPPTRDLPPPQTDDPAQKDAAWPVDQDEKRRKEAAARRKKEKIGDWTDLSRQLSPSELKKGAAKTDPELAKRSAETPEGYREQYSPSKLGYVGGLFGTVSDFFTGNNKDEYGKFEGEPPRASLTDPPSGYRTPSPAQPYGVGADKTKSKPMTNEDRVTFGTGSTR